MSFVSCKRYLDVNTNPNVALTATPQTLLPAAELYLGTAMGVDMQVDGGIWAQYWDESPQASQYRVLAQYNPGQDVFSEPWTNLYSANENFYQLAKLADSLKQPNYVGIALLMEAYTFQVITDAWGDVPFTQALQGQPGDGHLVNPVYDSQVVVYRGIIKYIDSAIGIFAKGSTLSVNGDLIYGGNIGEWEQFANTLKLKVFLRLAYIEPSVAQDSIEALFATSPSFIGTGNDAVIGYGYSSSNNNPLYSEEVGLGYVQNLVASNTCVDTMAADNDPRVGVFYAPGGLGSYSGIAPGSTSLPSNLSYPNYWVAGDMSDGNYYLGAKAPVNFLTSYESYFLQAEAAVRGWAGATAGQDSTLYYEGIQANFNYYQNGLVAAGYASAAAAYTAYRSGSTYWTNYPETGSAALKLQYIITQKWLSMCGNQGFEAWTEWRRTGYPNFLQLSQGNLDGNQFPKRFLYPTSESTVNTNYPGLQPITAKVWWDLN